MPRILLLSIFCFFLFGCEDEGGGLIERETDSPPSSSSDNSGSEDDNSESGDSDSSGRPTSSENKHKLSTFKIDPYLNSNVSSQSLTGTWVAVGSGSENNEEEDSSWVNQINQITVFTMSQSVSEISMSNCDQSIDTAKVAVDENAIDMDVFGEGVIKDNRYIETTYTYSEEGTDDSTSSDYSYKIAKVSDQVNSIGTLDLNFNVKKDINGDISCFRLNNMLSTDDSGESGYLTEISLSGVDTIEIFASDAGNTEIFTNNLVDSYLEDTNYEYSEFDNQSIVVDFNGSESDGDTVVGKVSVTIP